MKLTEESLDSLCALARLELTGEERAALAAPLEGLTAHMDALNELDALGARSGYHVLELENVLREDEAHSGGVEQALLDCVPATRDGFVLLPQRGEAAQ